MASKDTIVPIALFAYARPAHLRQTLDGLRANKVPLLYVFCDGARTPDAVTRVKEVRDLVRSVDWCEPVVVERETNLGLGVSLRSGVTEVLERHDRVLVFEDDIVPVPGAYAYLCAALDAYADDPRVMSIAAWTHPRIRPPVPADQPFFDGRFACWGWGTWRRAWEGMDVEARVLLKQCRQRWRNPARYGVDLVYMAENEQKLDIWAARFAMLHLVRGGLCFHPPHTLITNTGFDNQATNTILPDFWAQRTPDAAPVAPEVWPRPREHAASPRLWQTAGGVPPVRFGRFGRLLHRIQGKAVYGLRVLNSSSGIHDYVLRKAVQHACRFLAATPADCAVDYGCGTRPYDDALRQAAKRVVAVDLPGNPLADADIAENGRLPMNDASVGLVASFQVLEHVADPEHYLGEMARVCRPGGHLLLSVPSVWPYHPHPTDYRRWMHDGLIHDLAAHGFDVVRTWAVLNPISAALQYLLTLAAYSVVGSHPIRKRLVTMLAVVMNGLIVLSERWGRSSLRYGAGNYVVLAKRQGESVS